MSACCLTVWAKSDMRSVLRIRPRPSTAHQRMAGPRQPAAIYLTLVNFTPTLEGMDVQLSADQKAFFRLALETGRLSREEDAVEEALVLWEERERTRAEILALADRAEESHSQGHGRIFRP